MGRPPNWPLRLGVLIGLASGFACTASRPAAAPPASAVQNPPDIGAAIPHEEPPQPPREVLPPQQSEEEEKQTANRPGEPKLIDVMPTVLLDGEPFPDAHHYDSHMPEPRRTVYVSVQAAAGGNGSEAHPWNDLQASLNRLEPGDRLVVIPGIYIGPFTIGAGCRDGTKEAPIQVFADDAFLKVTNDADVLTVERPYWQFWEVQIALLHSRGAGLVLKGPAAHDIAIDQSHIYEGDGPAVRFTSGSSGIVLSNCHIHQGKGVQVDSGAKDIAIVSDHIHHNNGTSLTIGGGNDGAAPAENISVVGNRFHNDRGHAILLGRCRHITVSGNKISNYRPDGAFLGDAISVGSGSTDVTFERNTVLESSTAVVIGADSGPRAEPEHIVFRRNYLENQLTSESAGLVVLGGHDIRFENGVVNRYAEPFRIASSGVSSVTVANNLVIRPSLAWRIASTSVLELFDYNVFGADPTLSARFGDQVTTAGVWMKAHMPHSRIAPAADLANRDLGKIVGMSPVDAGKALEGIEFRGLAPDIGIAEH